MSQRGQNAVVCGASMAGLLAARVLSDCFGSITLVERDVLPEVVMQRRGVPQGKHLHQLLSRGSSVLCELFPGFFDDLAFAGPAEPTAAPLAPAPNHQRKPSPHQYVSEHGPAWIEPRTTPLAQRYSRRATAVAMPTAANR